MPSLTYTANSVDNYKTNLCKIKIHKKCFRPLYPLNEQYNQCTCTNVFVIFIPYAKKLLDILHARNTVSLTSADDEISPFMLCV